MRKLTLCCDLCGREEQETPDAERRWSKLVTVDRATRDICPTCVAGMDGWKGAA